MPKSYTYFDLQVKHNLYKLTLVSIFNLPLDEPLIKHTGFIIREIKKSQNLTL